MKFEVQLSEADIDAIADRLAAKISGTAPAAATTTTKEAKEAATGKAAAATGKGTAATGKPAEKAAATVKTTAEGADKAAVLAALRSYSDLYTREAATAALNKFATSVGDLKTTDYAALLADLAAPPAGVAAAAEDEF